LADDPVIQVLSAIGQEIRISILRLISREGVVGFTSLMKALELDPKEEAGRFNYHLRELEKAGLIKRVRETSQSGYQLTAAGVKVIQILDTLELTVKDLEDKIYVRTSRAKIEDFDRNKIKRSLMTEAGAPERLADQIAKEAEERLVNLRVQNLTAPMIREFVNAILLEKGLAEIQHELTRAGVPIHDLHQMIIQAEKYLEGVPPFLCSPELARWTAAEEMLRQYRDDEEHLFGGGQGAQPEAR